MQEELSKSARRVQDALEKMELGCRVRELPSSARSAQDAASAIGCHISQIVKSLIFRTQETREGVLVFVSGARQVDEELLEGYVGARIVKADAAFVREVTGFAIGGVPPVAHKMALPHIYIDEDLTLMDEVWAAAGTPHGVFCVSGQDLLRATRGRVVRLSR
ncbi:MAG: hypothetical protein C0514_02075 [Candidatus Puniceispirillum sp.]|nr:hypothetical protein [Candidatus Puniceispirillum sp.]